MFRFHAYCLCDFLKSHDNPRISDDRSTDLVLDSNLDELSRVRIDSVRRLETPAAVSSSSREQ